MRIGLIRLRPNIIESKLASCNKPGTQRMISVRPTYVSRMAEYITGQTLMHCLVDLWKC